jgi:hypothetical protein
VIGLPQVSQRQSPKKEIIKIWKTDLHFPIYSIGEAILPRRAEILVKY